MWWGWDLELSPHLLRRMVDRGFTEVDVRAMLFWQRRVVRNAMPGRWYIVTTLRGQPWRVVVEPDPLRKLLVVVTAFPTRHTSP